MFGASLTPWIALGLLGQVLFTARTALQWIASERAGRVRVPAGYWELSLLGSLALLAYAAWARDPIFLCGPLVNTGIFARNLALQSQASTTRPLGPGAELAMLGLVLAAVVASLYELSAQTTALPWVVIGGAGQALWLARYPLQWRHAERAGRACLPASFWRAGLLGSLLLLAYAVYRADPVFVLAFLLNPIPYARNLALLRRRPVSEEPRCP